MDNYTGVEYDAAVNSLSQTHYSFSGDFGDFKPLSEMFSDSVNSLSQTHYSFSGDFEDFKPLSLGSEDVESVEAGWEFL
jgi:hypothetical protein